MGLELRDAAPPHAYQPVVLVEFTKGRANHGPNLPGLMYHGQDSPATKAITHHHLLPLHLTVFSGDAGSTPELAGHEQENEPLPCSVQLAAKPRPHMSCRQHIVSSGTNIRAQVHEKANILLRIVVHVLAEIYLYICCCQNMAITQ